MPKWDNYKQETTLLAKSEKTAKVDETETEQKQGLNTTKDSKF
ncbi:hypothetical protein [Lyngbya aestuarii]